jgi:hypothetical protein
LRAPRVMAEPLITPDGRYIVVRGRLWRAANPSLSEEQRAEYTRELMTARRSVGAAKRAGDRDAERAARRAVDRAKRALGERGPAWWTDGAPDYNRRMAVNTPYREWYEASQRWEDAILELLAERDKTATICPSEVARRFEADGWRNFMSEVRDAARRLAERGDVTITQRGHALDPAGPFRGPIRISRRRRG